MRVYTWVCAFVFTHIYIYVRVYTLHRAISRYDSLIHLDLVPTSCIRNILKYRTEVVRCCVMC